MQEVFVSFHLAGDAQELIACPTIFVPSVDNVITFVMRGADDADTYRFTMKMVDVRIEMLSHRDFPVIQQVSFFVGMIPCDAKDDISVSAYLHWLKDKTS